MPEEDQGRIDWNTIWPLVGLIVSAVLFVLRDAWGTVAASLMLCISLCWLGIHIGRAKLGSRFRLTPVVITSLCLSIGAAYLGWPVTQGADVEFETISFNSKADYIGVWCKNYGGKTAKKELSMTGSFIVPLDDNGRVARIEQDRVWDAYDKLRTTTPSENLVTKDLPPGQHREAIFDGRNVTYPKPNDLMSLFQTGRTVMFTGATTWEDQLGQHRSEFCKWIRPFESAYAWSDCLSHNGLVF